MKRPKPKSFQNAMHLVICACWIFGIGIFEYPIGHPQRVLSFCWSLAHLSLYLYIITIAKVPEVSILPESTVATRNYYLSCFCATNFIITSMIVTWKAKTITNSSRQISEVNKNLKKFGITEDYGLVFKYQITQLSVCLVQIIIITFAIRFSTGSGDYFWEMSNFAFWISVYYQLIFIQIVGCTYCGCIRYIGNRFQNLNMRLLFSTSDANDTKPFPQYLDHHDSTHFVITREIHRNVHIVEASNPRWTVQVLREARNIHHELCVIARKMNQAYSIQIIFFLGISFCNTTSLLFTIYEICTIPRSAHTSLQYEEMVPGCCWLIAYATAVFHVVHCCSIVSSEAQQTGVVIHDRVKPNDSDEIQAEVDVFSLQMMHNPLEFTAHGFFALDYTLIRGMAGSVATYLVIMIQLRSIYDLKSDSTSIITLVTNSTK